MTKSKTEQDARSQLPHSQADRMNDGIAWISYNNPQCHSHHHGSAKFGTASARARYTEASEVIQSPHKSQEIANAIPVYFYESFDGQAINDRILVPEIIDHGSLQFVRPAQMDVSTMKVGSSFRFHSWSCPRTAFS